VRNGKKQEDDSGPNWQPISALAMVAFIVDEMLHETQEQYKNLLETRDKPHVLDDDIVHRVLSVYATQLDDAALFHEQLSRWKNGKMSSDQRQEVERLTSQVEKLQQICQDILSLAAELREGTINRILEKSDLQLGIDILTGKIKPPKL